MSTMSMTAEAARRALDAAKRDGAFVKRYLDGDRAAFAHMQRLMRAAYPEEGPGASRGAAEDSAFASAPTAAPMGDGGGGAMPEWLLEAGDAGFAPPKSPAHYKFDYAPHGEIDPAFDRLARDWMYQAELPAGWSSEIARDYQRRAAKPPSAEEVAREHAEVLSRLRGHWGDETDAKLAQVRDLVHGIGDERLIETLNRSGLGNNEWLIRQLAIHADRKAMKAAERGEADHQKESEASDEAGSPDRDLAYRTSRSVDDGASGLDTEPMPFVRLADKSGGSVRERGTNSESITNVGADPTDGTGGDFIQLAGRFKSLRPSPRPGPAPKPNQRPSRDFLEDLIDLLPLPPRPKPRDLEPTNAAGLFRYPSGRLYLVAYPNGKIERHGTKVAIFDKPWDLERTRKINPAYPTIEEDAALEKNPPAVEPYGSVIVEHRGDDGQRHYYSLVDPETRQRLRTPNKELVILTSQQVEDLGLGYMDTSRRNDPDYEEIVAETLFEALKGIIKRFRK